MENVFVFTGENDYALREECRRWAETFARKHGAENLLRLDGARLTMRELLDDVGIMPFLAEKRLVIVQGIPRCTKEEAHNLLGQIHPQVILLFRDPKPDKRLGGIKHVLSHAQVKEFGALQEPAIRQWMKEQAEAAGALLSTEGQDALLDRLGRNQTALATELAALSLYRSGETITAADVDTMTVPLEEGVIWKVTDLLAAGKTHAALSYAERMLRRGGDAYGLWAILLAAVRNLAAVHAALHSDIRSSKELAEQTGVHPFALRALLPYARRASAGKLRHAVSWAAEADVRLKTGGYRATAEASEELYVLIDRLIMAMP